MRRDAKAILATVAWLAAIAAAASLDRAVAMGVQSSGLDRWMHGHKTLCEILKSPGSFYFTAIVAVIVAIVHPWKWKAGGFLLLATVVSGVNGLIKWLVGRTRPFKFARYDTSGEPVPAPFSLEPLRGGIHGLFSGTNLCFPSGHAALAFATAAAVAMLWPKSPWRWLAYAIACIVAAERVAENAHWLSDTVAAAALGVGGGYLIHWALTKLLQRDEGDARPAESRLTESDLLL